MVNDLPVNAETKRESEGLISLESLKAAARKLQRQPVTRRSGIKICSCNSAPQPVAEFEESSLESAIYG